jgi:FkbM family methyltransferase
MRVWSRGYLLDAAAPLILEVPPDKVGLGSGRSVRRILMKHGYRMFVDLRVPEQREAWRTGTYEDRMIGVARGLLPDGGLFVDVGANVGFYTCGVGVDVLRRRGAVYAFEPVSSNRRLLRKNVAVNGLGGVITVLPLALGEERGKLVMRRVPVGNASNAVGQNMLSEWDRDEVERREWPSEEVDVVRLDDWSSDLLRCDVLKVDVEGADLLVLRGGIQTINRFRPVILAEFNPYWMRQIGQNIDDVRRFGGEVRYRILRLFGDRFLPLPPTHTDPDEEVPSYVLLPEERAEELAEALHESEGTPERRSPAGN